MINFQKNTDFFLGVSLANARVGVLRATLTLRYFAALRTAHAPSACLTQAVF
ncbi:MAG: hypothetical protein NZ455_16090 [Bacteroidia bacterium]|nr:hypothetical protein [Bacteroidia bacterium]